MTTETILPELVGTLASLPEHTQKTIKAYGAACARTALQSPEIQALRKDAERYRWLRNHDLGDSTEVLPWISAAKDDDERWGLNGEYADERIDAAMEQQK